MIGEVLFGRYRIDALTSSRAGELVWAGADLHALAPVTIKMSPADADPQRVLLEGEAMAAVRHPGVVRLVDFGLHQGELPCLIMERVEGETLAQRLFTAGRLPWFSAFELAAEALDGLAALHDEGLVHGDLAPYHLVLRRGFRVKVVGLGHVALASTEDVPAADRVWPLAHPTYKAPEQLSGAGQRVGSDIYAVGVMLWEAVSGSNPFSAAPEDIAIRTSFRPDYESLPAGTPSLPIAARLALDHMLQPSLAVRESDARRCGRRLRSALGIEVEPDRGRWARAM